MQSNSIRWGILGTSPISETMAKAIHESSTSLLLAVGSRSHEKAKIFSEKFSIPKVYSNYQDLLNDSEIDAIYLGLPNHCHKEWIIRAAKAGKHILCEKPLVVSIDEIREVISTVEKANIVCMEALMYRFHPLITKLQEIVQNKIIGEIKLYTATYTANIADVANPIAGGSIRNLGCYPISLIRLLANAEPIEIFGSGRLNKKNKTDSQASVLLKFADHSMAMVSTADDIDMEWQFDLYGTKGRLKVISNPWMPSTDNNKVILKLADGQLEEISVTANKSLYTYQIDLLNTNIMKDDVTKHNEAFLQHSLGNSIVLERWLEQVKKKFYLGNNKPSSEKNYHVQCSHF